MSLLKAKNRLFGKRFTTQDVIQLSSVGATVRHTPGYLLAPFGWASDALAEMVEIEPTLLSCLFELDRKRMHLIALALAHLNKVSPDLGRLLVGCGTDN